MSRKRIKKPKISKAKAMKELRRKIHKSIVESDQAVKPIETDAVPKVSETDGKGVLDEFQDIP